MLDHDDLLPEESQAENQSLIQYLERLHDTRVQDAVSFERMRQRLALADSKDQNISSPGTFSSQVQQVIPAYQASSQRTIQQLHTKKSGKRVLMTMVAILIVALVLAFALLRFQQTSPVSPQTHYKNGWVFVQSFSGTGSKKLTNLHIGPLQTIGMTVNCSDPTQQSAKFDLNYQVSGDSGHSQSSTREECTAGLSAPPQIYGTGVGDPHGSQLQVKNLTVTASPEMTWQVFVFKNINSPLTLDNAQWYPVEGQFSGYGRSKPSMMEVNMSADTPLPRTISVKYLCYGPGNIHISLSGSTSNTNQSEFPSTCDGKIHQKKFNGISLAGVDNITVQASTGCEWYVLVEGHK